MILKKINVLKGIIPKKANELIKLKSGKQHCMRKTMGRMSKDSESTLPKNKAIV